jgi:cystathionine beta-lyase/cystathionine gamma-synthase
MDAALKKLFALTDRLEAKLSRLDELEKRLTALDTNGKLDAIENQMKKVASNSQVVVTTVQSHGETIARLEKTLTRLNIRCPLLKPKTEELPSVGEVKPNGEGSV